MLSLERLSKRFERVLRAEPLRLRLNFSDTRLVQRHLDWLAHPSWKDRVEALTLYNWPAPASEERSRNFLDPGLCTAGDAVSPLLAVLRASQRASLRELLGMPLRLDGVPIPRWIPANFDDDTNSESQLPVPLVDLSMFCLKQLGVPSGYRNWFVCSNLPQTLVTLLYRGSYPASSVCDWEPCAAAHAAARLPCLSNIHLSGSTLVVFAPYSFPAVSGWHATIEAELLGLQVDSGSVDMPAGLFPGAREVRIDTRRVDVKHVNNEGGDMVVGEPADAVMDALVDMLCPPGLERMDIKSGSEFPHVWLLEDVHAGVPGADRRVWSG